MKKASLLLPSLLAAALYCTTLAAQSQPVIFPEEDAGTPETHEVLWPTAPGHRYLLEESTDGLGSWQTVEGYPAQTSARAQDHGFSTAEAPAKFFRVTALDDQPPAIASRIPTDDSFGVGRFSDLTVVLEDATGVDEASISISVGSLGPLTTASPELTFDGATLAVDLGGDTALGLYGEVIAVSLTVADTLGHSATYDWSFELEIEPVAAEGLFVFGSPQAQRAGQQLNATEATLAARLAGPVRASSSTTEWTLHEVTETTIVVAYTSAEAPVFNVGDPVSNLVPDHVEKMFYRRIDAISDDPALKLLTLTTINLSLTDVLENGSFQIPEEAVFLAVDEFGNIEYLARALEIDRTVDLPTIGADFSGDTLYDDGTLLVTLPEAKAFFYSKVHVSGKTGLLSLKQLEIEYTGEVDLAIVPRVDLAASYQTDFEEELWSGEHWVWFSVGIVPVGVQLDASVTAYGSGDFSVDGFATGGMRQTASMSVSGRYEKDASPLIDWGKEFSPDELEKVPLEYDLNGQGEVHLKLLPQVNVEVYGLGGLYVNVDPRVHLQGSASYSTGQLLEADWFAGAYADVNAGFSLIGFEESELPSLPPFELFRKEWSDIYPETPLQINAQPYSQNVKEGDPAVFTVEASGGDRLDYAWYHNGQRLYPNQSTLQLADVAAADAGQCYVKVSDGTQEVQSSAADLNVVTYGRTGSPPASGFAWIPGGSFQMGDSLGDGYSDELPVHTVTVDGFYMQRAAVTMAEWDTVTSWAQSNGYDITPLDGFGKGPDHPVIGGPWYECVKYANAKSEMEGLSPCYRVGGVVYRTGNSTPDVNYSASGYRLPTEAEWEYAARGGLGGQRFPWGATITHSQANYYVYSRDGVTNYNSYDVSPTRGYHPDWDDGGSPYTSPAGTFAPNGYGLYDMAGNLFEWCGDWYGSYPSGSVTNPTGPSSGTTRVVRGGSYFNHGAESCRVAYRRGYNPAFPGYDGFGFRLLRR